MNDAILDSMLWVHGDDLHAAVRKWLPGMNNRAEALEYATEGLEVTPKFDNPEPIAQWRKDGARYGLPVTLGLEWMGGLVNVVDERTAGTPVTYASSIDCDHPSVDNPELQREFFNDTIAALRGNPGVVCEAGTGVGKTICALNAAAELGTTVLVLVKSKALARQWVREIMKHLDVEYEEIGVVEGPICSFQNKKIVVCVIQNLCLKVFPDEFYNYFGFVVWDEGHALGAREFSRTMMMFPALYKLVLSATPYRKDGCDELIFNYFGRPKVVAVLGAMPVTSWIVRNNLYRPPAWLQDCQDGALMKWLSQQRGRNEMIGRIIQNAKERDRQFVVMSHSISHLEELRRVFMGANDDVTDQNCGLFTGSYNKANGKRGQHGQAYLTKIKEDPVFRYIFATYSMMKEGIDIPRLDCGIEAIPRADNVQAIGRIRRRLQRKLHPVWFTLEDTGITKLQRYTQARLRGFEEAGVKLERTDKFAA